MGKAFEEWFENLTFDDGLYKNIPAWKYLSHTSPRDVGRIVWKAALKWVLENHCLSIWNEHDLDFIKKELEETKNESDN